MTNCFKPLLPFPPAQCASEYSGQTGPFFERPHFPAVRKNFVEPAVRSPVIIELTDTQSLYIGQGILIGSSFYQITDILDSLRVELQHNGLGAVPGNTIVALHPEFGVYQYLVIPVGKVVLDTSPSYAGVNAAGDTAVASSIVAINVNQIAYGFTGPTTFDFQAQFTGQIDNTPHWIALALPVAARADVPYPAIAAFMDIGAGPIPAVAKLGVGSYSNHLLIGPGGGSTIADGAGLVFSAAGHLEILV
jgi:predicted RecA/RadA family phage recombinase